jgi:hypothetical protein
MRAKRYFPKLHKNVLPSFALGKSIVSPEDGSITFFQTSMDIYQKYNNLRQDNNLHCNYYDTLKFFKCLS